MACHDASDTRLDQFFERLQLCLIQLGVTFVDDRETKMGINICITVPRKMFRGWRNTTLNEANSNRLRILCNLCGV